MSFTFIETVSMTHILYISKEIFIKYQILAMTDYKVKHLAFITKRVSDEQIFVWIHTILDKHINGQNNMYFITIQNKLYCFENNPTIKPRFIRCVEQSGAQSHQWLLCLRIWSWRQFFFTTTVFLSWWTVTLRDSFSFFS